MNQYRNQTKVIMLTLTENCNLNCTYCFEHYKSPKTMTYESTISILNQEIVKTEELYRFEVDFFGGEPFLEFELLKKICNYIWSKNWFAEVICFATTNGTIIHGEIREWLYKNRDRFVCSLSLDGVMEAHNVNRSDSYNDIDVGFFVETWPMQPYKMTISKESIDYLAKSIIWFHENNIKFSCNFAYGVDWKGNEIIEKLEQQLNMLIEYYLVHTDIEPCDLLNMKIENINTEIRIERWCGAGKEMRAYDIKGERYPCHLFFPLSIGKNKSNMSYKIDFSKETKVLDTRCDGCVIYNICPTCYGSNYAATGKINMRDEGLCCITKLTALATAFLYAKKIENTNDWKKIFENEEKYANIVHAIVRINQNIQF